MKSVIVDQNFTGYPTDKKDSRRDFVQGEEVEFSDAYADLVVGKGHAHYKPGSKAEAKKDDKA